MTRERVERCVGWFKSHGGFDNSDNYPAYDRLVDAWRGSIDEMVKRLEGVEGL